MKLVNCGMPHKWKGDYDESEFQEYDVKNIAPSVAELYYWYGSGCYCGGGEGIYVTDSGAWEHASFGHCSCYGPTECLETITRSGHNSWQELVATFSDELKKDCATIIAALKERPANSEGQ